MIASPLEQFAIKVWILFKAGFIDLSITNMTIQMFVIIGLITFLFAPQLVFHGGEAKLIPTPLQSIPELTYEFVFNMVDEQIGKKGYQYFPIIMVTFLFVLFSNLVGMIPYCFTVTSHIIITFSLAAGIFIGINYIGFEIHKLHFFSFFLPTGAPIVLAPLLVGIETISYVFRVFSLAIRLFANMMSGHTLLKILAGFSYTMLGSGFSLFILHFIPLLIVFLLVGLELGIAFLQAYVFTILTCIYLSDAIKLH